MSSSSCEYPARTIFLNPFLSDNEAVSRLAFELAQVVSLKTKS
jgi:hypothetical protein